MWSLLSVVAEEERRDLRCYLQRALEVWSKQGKLTQPLVRTVCSHTANKQHEKVSRAFLGGYLELYMYMYLPSPLYNMLYVHVCTMHVHTYYMYIHVHGFVYNCFAWGDFSNNIMYTECTPILAPR